MADVKLAVSAEVIAFVASGGRDIDLARVPGGGDVPAGTSVRLTNESGTEFGAAIADPDNKLLRVYLQTADGFTKIDGGLLASRVEDATKRRERLGLLNAGECYRLFHGAGDRLPGMSCDVLGDFAVLYVYADALLPLADVVADAVRGFAKCSGVVVKTRLRGGASESEQRVVGKAPPERYEALERGVRFEIHPMGGLNVGLFTDMREQRAGLARFASGKRVLNLFSYTGALSVACARAGAASVVSVDTSQGVNDWAQGNFARSGYKDTDKRWRFETGDAARFLARANRDRETYDLILIDPPTFSPARGANPWTLAKDYPALIASAAKALSPHGLLWIAANTHELGSLVKLASKGLERSGRWCALLEQGGLPPDYPTVPVQPWDRYLQTALFAVT